MSVLPIKFESLNGYWLEINNSFVEVINEWGCNITNLVLDGQPILAGHKTEKELKKNHLSKSDFLLPFPNRVADGKYEFEGDTHELNINEITRNNAIHGLIFNKSFKKISSDKNEHSVSVVFRKILKKDEFEGYPFDLQCDLIFTLGKDTFEVEIKTKNIGIGVAPYGTGWHPYFTVNKTIDDCTLYLPADSILENRTTKELIPTGELMSNDFGTQPSKIGSSDFDTCFTNLKEKKVTFENVEITFDNSMKYVQVYTPEDRESIAIEPMTCAPDAFNNKLGLITIKPGHTVTNRIKISVA